MYIHGLSYRLPVPSVCVLDTKLFSLFVESVTVFEPGWRSSVAFVLSVGRKTRAVWVLLMSF